MTPGIFWGCGASVMAYKLAQLRTHRSYLATPLARSSEAMHRPSHAYYRLVDRAWSLRHLKQVHL